MGSSDVEAIVFEALREVQELGGHEWRPVAPNAAVIGVLEGFDSLTGIEATVIVDQKIGKKLGRVEPLAGIDSIFVSRDGRKALSVAEVVSTVCAAIEVAA